TRPSMAPDPAGRNQPPVTSRWRWCRSAGVPVSPPLMVPALAPPRASLPVLDGLLLPGPLVPYPRGLVVIVLLALRGVGLLGGLVLGLALGVGVGLGGRFVSGPGVLLRGRGLRFRVVDGFAVLGARAGIVGLVRLGGAIGLVVLAVLGGPCGRVRLFGVLLGRVLSFVGVVGAVRAVGAVAGVAGGVGLAGLGGFGFGALGGAAGVRRVIRVARAVLRS